jgi:aspartyl/glutamyl-tRNA(Asn/Gln) amidotransferase C subunit
MPNSPELDRDALQHLANLARLHLTSERLPLLRARLQRLVAAFGALPQGSTEAAVFGPGLPLRDDVAGTPLPTAAALANAPQQAAGAFLVPRVVDA